MGPLTDPWFIPSYAHLQLSDLQDLLRLYRTSFTTKGALYCSTSLLWECMSVQTTIIPTPKLSGHFWIVISRSDRSHLRNSQRWWIVAIYKFAQIYNKTQLVASAASTQLNNISQNGSFPEEAVKTKSTLRRVFYFTTCFSLLCFELQINTFAMIPLKNCGSGSFTNLNITRPKILDSCR